MNIVISVYGLIMFATGVVGLRKKLAISKVTLTIIDLLFILSIANLWITALIIDILISVLLIFLSISLYRDRLSSGLTLNMTHHILRLCIHLIFIYFLFR
ncbi:hypothetical protein SAMN05421791_10867 [Facklamia miroungae]|uniref:Inner membrane protein n=1 Tax=Facklamia miroungae TaxID=120956 RepID=A0A1G7U4W4_9LACT|nr:hypothetical protein SAMN05421791_10867 [Facklamia miroungae]